MGDGESHFAQRDLRFTSSKGINSHKTQIIITWENHAIFSVYGVIFKSRQWDLIPPVNLEGCHLIQNIYPYLVAV